MLTSDPLYVVCRNAAEVKLAERILTAFQAIQASTQGHGEIVITLQCAAHVTNVTIRHVVSYQDKLTL